MRLHRLTVAAFGPFAGTEEVDFDALSTAGIFLLHGPTGAGKTSILDAVCYALYGEVPGARQGAGAALRSDHAAAGTATEISLELTVAGRRLEITRRPAQLRRKLRGTGFTTEKAQSWLRQYDADSGDWRALSRSHQEIGEEISQLLGGMSRDQFCQVVLLPQGDFARFLRADAEARGKLLGRLFDTRRFAAVEDRLAELRRAAEHQVRAGDERLLSVAQRIAQAARDSSAPPLPERQPGDPGLAPAVLEWAALARSLAVERADIAAAALEAAGSRQAAARTALDGERELARLQDRFAETRQRADTLEQRRPARDRAQAVLDRAHKAELVAPALELREDAERAHRGAAAEHDRVLHRRPAHLPASLAEAGAEQLVALERAVSQQLGALDAARTAEQRSAHITQDRAALDQEARSDEAILADAVGWLSGWESTRAALLARIDEAQVAAARAEQLAGQLDPAARQLAAARRRDDLQGAVGKAAQTLNAAKEHTNQAHERWLELRERRLHGMAAELAARLADGEPCAVCGSADHPAPARATDGQVDPAAEESALNRYRSLGQARDRADVAHSAVRERYVAAEAEADGASVAELTDLTRRLEDEHRAAHTLAAGTHAAREALESAEREHRNRLAAQSGAERRIAARTSRREALDAEQAALRDELAKARGDAPSVAARAAQLESGARWLAAAADAVRTVETTAVRLKEADDKLASAAFRAGFDTPGAAADALLDTAGRRATQRLVDEWQTEAAKIAERLAEPDTADAAGRPAADPEAARTAHDMAERALRDASSARATADDRRTELARLSRQAESEVRALGPLREEYDRVARLAGLAAGTSSDNERRMRLEAYVLAARLEQVAAAATVRLQRMSAGRYALLHSDARAAGRSRSGLGLQVVDAWTGSARDTSTLSGGETFFASLALALGLADVVTDEAGGVRLDTLFIDEGFGSLDDQTLDEVLDVLDSLRERDRSVGIVSHVADLRRRIPAQLEVVKERQGSTILALDADRTSG